MIGRAANVLEEAGGAGAGRRGGRGVARGVESRCRGSPSDHGWVCYATAATLETATCFTVDSGGGGRVGARETAVAAAAAGLVAVIWVLLLMAELLFLDYGYLLTGIIMTVY